MFLSLKKVFLSSLGLIFFLHLNAQVLKPSFKAFKKGERLEYLIHYGPINAGKATFVVRDTLLNIKDKPHYYFTVFGRSMKSWDWFYKVRDHYFSIVDTVTMLPSIAIRDVQEGDYEIKEKVYFNRKENVVTKGDTAIKVPPGVHDLLSIIYFSRCLDFSKTKMGDFFPMHTFFSDTVFPVGVSYQGKKIVKTRLGHFRCKVFKPRLVKGRIFKGQDDMTLYVSDDKNQVPIRIESAIFVGYIQVDLVDFKDLKYPLTSRIE